MKSTSTLHWVLLIAAGLIEVAWALSLKYAEGFTRFWPSVASVLTIAASMFCLSYAMRALPVGIAYGVFVGMGAIGTALVGIFAFGEPVSPMKMTFLGMLLVAIVGLKVTGE